MIENNVMLIGNLVADVEGKYSFSKKVDANGQPIQFFSGRGKIAVKYDYDKQKQQDVVSFIDFDFIGKKFEKIANYMVKGTKIGISGRIETGSYQNNKGQTVYYTRVRADEVKLLGGKKKEEAQQAPSPQAPQYAQQAPSPQAPQYAQQAPAPQAPQYAQQAPAPQAWMPQG